MSLNKYISEIKNNSSTILIPLVLLSGLPVFICYKNYNYVLEEYYFFILTVLAIGISTVSVIKNNNFSIKLSKVDLFVSLYFIYIIANSIIYINTICKIEFVTQILITLIYIVIRRQKFSKNTMFITSNILLIVGYCEIIGAYLQYFEIIPKLQTNMPFGGSFANPAPFSVFISFLFPVILYSLLWYKHNSKFIFYSKILFLILSSILLTIAQIRASWIAVVIGCGIVIAHRFELKDKFNALSKSIKFSILFFVIISAIIISIGLFNFKKDSSLGRLFVWKITVEAIKENPIIGNGIKTFTYNYNKAQANYFDNGEYTDKEFLIADDILMAYNDYLQKTVELGIIGSLLLILIIVFATKTAFLNKQNSHLIMPGAVIVSFAVVSLFSYPFTILKSQVLFFIMIAGISQYAPNIYCANFKFPISSMIQKTIVGAITIMCLFVGIQQLYYIDRWRNCIEKLESNSVFDALKELKIISKTLNYDRSFLYNYHSILVIHSNSISEIILFESQMNSFFNNYNYFISKGDFYFTNKNYIQATINFQNANNLIPSRIIPRYKLLQCYIQLGDGEMAKKMADEILNTPVKIYNEIVEDIQNKTKQYIGSN